LQEIWRQNGRRKERRRQRHARSMDGRRQKEARRQDSVLLRGVIESSARYQCFFFHPCPGLPGQHAWENGRCRALVPTISIGEQGRSAGHDGMVGGCWGEHMRAHVQGTLLANSPCLPTALACRQPLLANSPCLPTALACRQPLLANSPCLPTAPRNMRQRARCEGVHDATPSPDIHQPSPQSFHPQSLPTPVPVHPPRCTPPPEQPPPCTPPTYLQHESAAPSGPAPPQAC